MFWRLLCHELYFVEDNSYIACLASLEGLHGGTPTGTDTVWHRLIAIRRSTTHKGNSVLCLTTVHGFQETLFSQLPIYVLYNTYVGITRIILYVYT